MNAIGRIVTPELETAGLETVAIAARGLGRHYGAHRAVDGLDFTLDAGTTLALIGHNGAGKTTLMKLILGLIRPTVGSLKVLGVEPSHAALEHRRHIGFLPENVAFHDELTGTQTLRYSVADPFGAVGTGSLQVTVVDDQPVATPRSASSAKGGSVTIQLGGTDPTGGTLTCQAPNATAAGNSPLYSVHELSVRSNAYLPVLSCQTTNEVRDTESVQWIVMRPFGATCSGGTECFTLPTLPASFPRASGQEPYYYAHKTTGRPNPPGPLQPYKTHFRGIPNSALYPFGHGLTYGKIDYSDFALGSPTLGMDGQITISARVTNRGTRAAEEVVQLYTHDRTASVTRLWSVSERAPPPPLSVGS